MDELERLDAAVLASAPAGLADRLRRVRGLLRRVDALERFADDDRDAARRSLYRDLYDGRIALEIEVTRHTPRTLLEERVDAARRRQRDEQDGWLRCELTTCMKLGQDVHRCTICGSAGHVAAWDPPDSSELGLVALEQALERLVSPPP